MVEPGHGPYGCRRTTVLTFHRRWLSLCFAPRQPKVTPNVVLKKKMNNSDSPIQTAISCANDLLTTCKKASTRRGLSQNDKIAFGRDQDFLNNVMSILNGGSMKDIVFVWNDINHLSRFLGGDYVLSSKLHDRFQTQCDKLHHSYSVLIENLQNQEFDTQNKQDIYTRKR